MGLAAGTKVGPYEIVSALGAGGMGEVYRARDSRLGREVAIKILPDYVAADHDRLRRFEHEARLLAALNHTNIASLYGVEESSAGRALVMELAPGHTLADRIQQGPIPADEAIAIARQIAEALEYAHERGIVHRDLKPANVKILPDDTVKVLDFGLAKALEEERGAAGSSSIVSSPTLTAASTKMGQIMGTAAYMSPEQAKGKLVDRRSDVWSFGCVLFEMLTGKMAFGAETVTETLAAVVRGEPDWALLPKETPPTLRRLVQRCLRKDTRSRLQSIGDARIALEEVASGIDATGVAAAPTTGKRAASWWAALGLVALAAAGLTLAISRYAQTKPAPTRLSITLPAGQVVAGFPAVSRDGRQIAYPAKDVDGIARLYVRALDSYEAKVIPNSEGAMLPFFSPEGGRIGFFAKGKLLTASLSGGPPTPLADVSYLPFGGAWGEDDTIIYVPALTFGLYRIPAAGGNAERLTEPDGAAQGYSHNYPQWLPGGRTLLFSVWGGEHRAATGPAILNLETRKWARVADTMWATRYASSGHLLVSGTRGITAFAFDGKNSIRSQAPTFVLGDVWAQPTLSNSWVAVSDTGTLVYVPGDGSLTTQAWVDRNGSVTPVTDKPESTADPALSPDGTRLLVSEGLNIWVVDMRRGTHTRITLDNEGSNLYPIWSHDGTHVFFGSNRSGDWDMYSAPAGGGEATRLLAMKSAQFPLSQAADGTLLFSDRSKGTDFWTLSPDGKATPFLVSPANKTAAQFSPDGRLVAFVSDDTGRNEVYLRSFAKGDDVTAVSSDGGGEPLWSPDGKELFYRLGDGFYSVKVTSESPIALGQTKKLFEMKNLASGRSPMRAGYAVSKDGNRFLVFRLDARAIPTQINVVENWFEELKAKVPGK